MVTKGHRNHVLNLISNGDYDHNNNSLTINLKNPFKELMKSIFHRTQHTLPVISLALLEKIPIDSKKLSYYDEMVLSMREKFASLLGNNGVLIFPSFPDTAPHHNQSLLTNPIDWICYYGMFNLLGLPSTQVTLGLSENERLPVGIQLISNRFNDRLTMRLATLIEKELVSWVEP